MAEREKQEWFPITKMVKEADLGRITLAALKSELPIRVVARGRQEYRTALTDALDTIFLPIVPSGIVRVEILFQPGKSDLSKVIEEFNKPEA